MRVWTRVAAALLLVVAVSAVGAADAARTTAYADWGDFAGSSRDYATSFEIPLTGFPSATVTTDSRAGNVGIKSGATNWIGENTPIGLTYGSSRNQEYLALRPRFDNAAGGSTTTYVFDEPTPTAGWTFALSDIDADQATVTATDASGAPVPEAGLGFVSGFNFCDTTPRPSTCSTSIGDAPTWDPATQTLTGNPQAMDTIGAIGWFEPTVAIKTMTVVFTRRAGLPLYSTSFAAVGRTLSGTVDDVSTGAGACPVDGTTVRLVGPSGEDLGSATPDAAGAYSFGQVVAQPGYAVSVEQPADCLVVGPDSRTVSTVDADATADFEIRAIVPQTVSGEVTADGDPLPGVTVTLHRPDGSTATTTSAADGSYLFDDNAVGDGYYVSIDVPDGYSGTDQRDPFGIDDAPIAGQDFALTADPVLPPPTPTEPTPTATDPTATAPSPTPTEPASSPSVGPTPPSSSGGTGPGGGLPDTGGTGALPLYAGALLVAAGAAALLARRRAR